MTKVEAQERREFVVDELNRLSESGDTPLFADLLKEAQDLKIFINS